MLGIVVSRADSASVHIGDHLLDLADWSEEHDPARPEEAGGGVVYTTDNARLRVFEELHIDIENVGRAFDTDIDLIAVASRHAGETGPLLTAHHTGNFGPAAYGGTRGRFARAAPGAHKRIIEAFDRVVPDGYEVATECTHHGPTDVDTPFLFCELGSNEAEWNDPAGARAVAEAMLSLCGVDPAPARTIAGFGGGHYANRFLRITRETDWAVGHVAAAWGVEEMGAPENRPGVLEAAMDRSGTQYAVVDGREPAIEAVLEDLGYRVVSETWVRESSGIDLDLVEGLEARLGGIDDGLRFGDQASTVPSDIDGSVRIETLPADLLAAVQGIDRDETREAVEKGTVAFETDEGGTRVAGRVALAETNPGSREEIIEAFVDLLIDEYGSGAIERESGAVVVSERVFDPERARELGVEDGPAFGRLAADEAVDVDGRTVTPREVHTERKRRFPTAE